MLSKMAEDCHHNCWEHELCRKRKRCGYMCEKEHPYCTETMVRSSKFYWSNVVADQFVCTFGDAGGGRSAGFIAK